MTHTVALSMGVKVLVSRTETTSFPVCVVAAVVVAFGKFLKTKTLSAITSVHKNKNISENNLDLCFSFIVKYMLTQGVGCK